MTSQVNHNQHLSMYISFSNLPPPTEIEDSKNNLVNPFDLLWLKNHYQLDIDAVEKILDPINGYGFEVAFKREVEFCGADLIRNTFMAALTAAGCKPQYNNYRNSVVLDENLREKLIAGIDEAQRFIPPIKKGKDLNQKFLEMLPLVKNFLYTIRAAYAEYQSKNLPYTQVYGIYYNEDYKTVTSFVKEIKCHLPLLRETLALDDYTEKLQFYYFTEKNLISNFQVFVNSFKSSLGNFSDESSLDDDLIRNALIKSACLYIESQQE